MTSSNFVLKQQSNSKISKKAKISIKRCRISSRFRKYIICQHFFINILKSSNFGLKIANKSKLSQKAKISLERCTILSRFRKFIICQHLLDKQTRTRKRAKPETHIQACGVRTRQDTIERANAALKCSLKVMNQLYLNKTEYIRIA